MAANKIVKTDAVHTHETSKTRGGLVQVTTSDGHIVYGLTEEAALAGVGAARNPDNGKSHKDSGYQL